MSRIIGIDLGTTTSEIAFINNGKPQIINDIHGERIIPSVVGKRDNNIIVGKIAYNQLLSDPDKTVAEIKRLMGTDEKVKLGDEEYLPHEISAIILKELKQYAQEYLGEEVTEAVITVPANFDNNQRKLTKLAGEMAGFKVERIINEPTAAAMGYGIDNLDKEEKVLVYDLGGGTFDVTILEMFDGILDVISSRGNNRLGGKDFDERIELYIEDEFKKQHGVDLYETGINYKEIKPRIKEAAINAKKELSSQLSTNINIPFITILDNRPINLYIELTRQKFDELTADLVKSTIDTINEALNAANCNEEDIDVVLLVGGSSRMASVQSLVNGKFPNKVKAGINPDEAVALGAAVQAGIKSDEIKCEESLIVTDKCSYNLGTSIVTERGGRLVEGVFDCLIPIDSSIPCSHKKTYYTVYDNQTEVNVDVYEGSASLVYENTKIGDFILPGIPEGVAGSQGIEIEFNYDLNGILQVKATIVSTGKSISKVIDNFELTKSNDSNIIEGILNDRIDLTNWINCELAPNVKSTINLAERKMKNLDYDKANTIEVLINNLKTAVINNDEELVEKYDEELTDLLFEM